MFYLSYAGYEVRKWMRDSLTSFMVFYPLILGIIARLIPVIEDRAGFNLKPYYHVILVFLTLMIPRISGAVAAFSILEDRDDNILFSVKVAPLSLEFFIGLKLAMVYVLGFLGTAFLLWFSNLTTLSAGVILEIAFLSSFGGPLTALLINYVASNKVEGFAAVKSLNALLLFPVFSLFIFDKKEFLFALEPGFWPAKALSTIIVAGRPFQLTYGGYYMIGLVYVVALTIGAYLLFAKKVQSS